MPELLLLSVSACVAFVGLVCVLGVWLWHLFLGSAVKDGINENQK